MISSVEMFTLCASNNRFWMRISDIYLAFALVFQILIRLVRLLFCDRERSQL